MIPTEPISPAEVSGWQPITVTMGVVLGDALIGAVYCGDSLASSVPEDKIYIDDASFVWNTDVPVPVTGIVGLGLLAGVCAVAGAAVIRRKK